MGIYQNIRKRVLENERIYPLAWKMVHAYRTLLMKTAQMVKGIDGNKVTFSSFQAKAYNDNPRYISEMLHQMRPDTKIVWLWRKDVNLEKLATPDYVRNVYAISFRGLLEQATARVWVDNVKKSESLYISPKQFYVNTWHGDRGFKRVGADNNKLNMRHPRLEKKCSMMLAGSDFGENVYRTAFDYQGEVMKAGCPRNDLLINPDPAVADKVRKGLGIPADARVLIYAPTFRDTSRKDKQHSGLDILRTLKCFEETTGEKWVCLFRAHYMASQGLDFEQLKGRIIDATRWPEMAELLLIGDALISDYSSCTCDFTLTRRPAFLYIEDLDDYTGKDRELYFDLEKSPFLLARNMEELEALIRTTDAEKAREVAQQLDAFYKTCETGHATRSACEYIIDKLD